MTSLSGRPILFLDEHAAALVRAYFERDESGCRFTGAMFERLGGGGDRPEVADRFTADDLVAVTMLSVDVPPQAALRLLADDAEATFGLLSEIPVGVDIWEADRSALEDGSPADRLWHDLAAIAGIAWVTAGKILARKRPRLLPVYDQVVRDAMGRPDNFWTSLWDEFQADDQRLAKRLREVRDEADVGNDVPLLRVLDVAIWMRNHGKKEARDDALRRLEQIRSEPD